jgi:hypothetical protein
LAFILAHHQTQRGWNAFVRVRLALTLKPSLQHRALNNMRSGGKYKGLANLPEAHHVDVRQQLADLAGVCPRNVGNVESILELAHPTLIEALKNGTLKIHRAMEFCRLPQAEQFWANLSGLQAGQKIQIVDMNSKKHSGTFVCLH